jgi:hypothetical protein
MLAQAPDLDIFSQNLVVTDAAGWQITDAGRSLLASIEKPAAAAAQAVEPALPVAIAGVEPPLIGTRRRTRRRRRADPVPPRRRTSR